MDRSNTAKESVSLSLTRLSIAYKYLKYTQICRIFVDRAAEQASRFLLIFWFAASTNHSHKKISSWSWVVRVYLWVRVSSKPPFFIVQYSLLSVYEGQTANISLWKSNLCKNTKHSNTLLFLFVLFRVGLLAISPYYGSDCCYNIASTARTTGCRRCPVQPSLGKTPLPTFLDMCAHTLTN